MFSCYHLHNGYEKRVIFVRKMRRLSFALVLLTAVSCLSGCGQSKEKQYDAARNLYYYGQYSEARKAFRALEDYADSKAMITACDYQLAMAQLADGESLGAATAFAALGEYGNSKNLSQAAGQLAALQQYEDGDTQGALAGLEGTRIAEDLGSHHESKDELAPLLGNWSCTLDILPDVKAALTELAQNQDKMDKDFPEKIEIKDLSVKVTLAVSKDGLAVLSLGQEELDRVTKSYAAQLHQGVTGYYDTVIDKMAEDGGFTREEVIENHQTTDAEGVFEAEGGIRFAEFERRMTPSELFSGLKSLYNDAGIAKMDGQTLTLRLSGNTWEVDASQEGKLVLTDGANTLTVTRIP